MVNKVIAAIVSFVLPGIGHMIQGEYKYGLLIFILTLIVFGLVDFLTATWIAEMVWVIIGVFACLTAYKLPEY